MIAAAARPDIFAARLVEASPDAGYSLEGAFRTTSVEGILDLFRPSLGTVYYRVDPENPKSPLMRRVLAVFEIVK